MVKDIIYFSTFTSPVCPLDKEVSKGETNVLLRIIFSTDLRDYNDLTPQ